MVLVLYTKNVDFLARKIYRIVWFDNCFLIAGQEWNKVLNGEVRKEVEEFLQQDAHLDEYAGQVLHYNSYVEQASLVPTSALLHVFR